MSQKKRLSAIMGTPVQAQEAQGPIAEKSATYPPLTTDNAKAAGPEKRSGAARSMAALWLTSTVSTPEHDDLIVELDPDLCDPSAIADRVPDATDPGFEAFKIEIQERGQHTPILVRRKQADPGRYEIAYGRRRTKAAKMLGRKVRAIIRDLSDDELVIAQGTENLLRQDLSYIERAYFALNMSQAGVTRDVILKTMGIDKSELSRYLTVAEGIPVDVLVAIGPAPKVGRPRWITLADRLKIIGREQVDVALSSSDFGGQSTDERFSTLLASLSAEKRRKARPKVETLKDKHGLKFALVERSDTGLRVTVEKNLEPGFGDYLADRLPEILAAYRAAKG